jgi:two-component system phosphate regulon sensor histidine kinase PhoR
MAKRKLLFRLLPSYLAIIFVTLVVTTWGTGRILTSFYLDHIEKELRVRVQIMALDLARFSEKSEPPDFQAFCRDFSQFDETRVTVILPDGRVTGDSAEDPARMDNHGDRPEIREAIRGGIGTATRYSPTLREFQVYAAAPVTVDGTVRFVLRTSLKVGWLNQTLGNIYRKIALYGTLVGIAGIVISTFVSKMITRPIYELREGADRFAQGKFDRSLPVPEIEEIGALAEAMNHMSGEINRRIVEVTEQRNRLDAILSSMVEGVIAVDATQRILWMNRAAVSLLNLQSAQDPVGRLFYEAIRNSAFHHFVDRILSEKQTIEEEVSFFDNNPRSFTIHGTVLLDATGKCCGALTVLNDVTRIRKLESLRSEFVANVSHEIRTPLTAIRASVETLMDTDPKDRKDREKLLKIVVRHTERLGSIVDDLLNLSRLEQNDPKENELKPVAIGGIVDSAVTLCREKAAESEIRITGQCAPEIVARADAPLIEQALVNLIDNAIKYGGAKSVIHVTGIRTGNEIRISVKDEGCGIAEEHLPRIFERFYRVDKARSRKLGGTGLGLAIVKHIMELHKGRIEVKSELGKGSCFTMILPGKA